MLFVVGINRRWLVCSVLPAFASAFWACGDGGSAPSPLMSSGPPVARPATIAVQGFVENSAFKPLTEARVEVVDGPQTGVSASTDARGGFALSGVLTGTKLRASKEGYGSSERVVQASQMEFILAPEGQGPPVNIAGRYFLAVDADPSCTDFPSALRHRSYEATVTPENSSPSWPMNTVFRADLSGAGLDAYFHFVPMFFAGDVVLFDMSDNGIEEEVAEEAYVFVGGIGRGTVRADGTISGPLAGVIDYCVVESDPGNAYPCSNQALERVRCEGLNHRMTLTPR